MLASLYIGTFALAMTDVEMLRPGVGARGVDMERRIFDNFAANLESNDVPSPL